ncbi:MAG TPA: PilZ domain-containing protein [Polyangia bacterium]|nr:PilZ domain-containing protein [Polyangia bacterium]
MMTTQPPSSDRPNGDRRTSRRTKLDLFVNRFLDGQPQLCRMTNLSRTGARLVPVMGPRRVPRYMGLQFQLPGTDTVITASGEAVTADAASTVGIRFTNLPPDAVRAIDAFLKAS